MSSKSFGEWYESQKKDPVMKTVTYHIGASTLNFNEPILDSFFSKAEPDV